MEIETHLAVHDYLNRICGWLSVRLSQALNKFAPESLSLKGWRFRYIWNDDLEQVKTEYPVLVLKNKKMILINLKREVYPEMTKNENKYEHHSKEWAYALLKLFFGKESSNPVKDLFQDDDDIVDNIEALCDDQERYLENGVYTIDYVLPYDAGTDYEIMTAYCDEVMTSATDVFDTIN